MRLEVKQSIGSEAKSNIIIVPRIRRLRRRHERAAPWRWTQFGGPSVVFPFSAVLTQVQAPGNMSGAFHHQYALISLAVSTV